MLDPKLEAPLNDAFGKLKEDEKSSVQARYFALQKNAMIAYLLWFALGGLMVYLFYLGKTKEALIRLLALPVLSGLFFSLGLAMERPTLLGVAGVLGVVLGIWWVVDLFRIPSLISNLNKQNAEELLGAYGK